MQHPPETTPPPSPTSSGSSEASPQNPGAAAPGPTPYVVVGDDTPTSPLDDLRSIGTRKRHTRECGGVIRLDRK